MPELFCGAKPAVMVKEVSADAPEDAVTKKGRSTLSTVVGSALNTSNTARTAPEESGVRVTAPQQVPSGEKVPAPVGSVFIRRTNPPELVMSPELAEMVYPEPGLLIWT